ncbi:MAG: hypothetical protein WDN46_04995 [Methylocella sp.]
MKTLSAFGGDHDPNYFNRVLSHDERARFTPEEFELFSSGLDEVREVAPDAASSVRAQLRWVMVGIGVVSIIGALSSCVHAESIFDTDASRSACAIAADPQDAVGASTMGNDPQKYCHDRYQAKRFASLKPEGRQRLIDVCAIAEARRQ